MKMCLFYERKIKVITPIINCTCVDVLGIIQVCTNTNLRSFISGEDL